MHSADQSSPKEPEEASASRSLERPTFISTITTETFYPLPDGESCQSVIGGSPGNPIPCLYFDSFKDDDDEWHKNTNFGIHLFIGMLIGLGCLGCLIYLIKCAIKSCDQDEHAQDHREHDLEMRVEEQSRSPEESRRENVVHALVHRDYDRDVNEERRKRATAGAGSSRGYQETEV
ncbi:uncharacterized protein LOC143453329 isoform X1 [Clavelina lepadiformis]|uniref:uncharacterized protein LOC143453329 isoform X1 n=1 Tax=Clavelina lepadiformis TaxID=159417 RepID=UPI0040418970